MRHVKAMIIAVIIFSIFILSVVLFTSGVVVPLMLNIGKSTKVPILVNMKIADAKKEIEKSGFLFNDSLSVERKFTVDYEEGIVLSQSPRGGKIVKKGDLIKVVVSLGTEQVIIPTVEENNYINASSKLKQMGFAVVLVKKKYGILPLNMVAKIEPESGTKVLKGSTVKLFIESDIDEEYLDDIELESSTEAEATPVPEKENELDKLIKSLE